MPVDPFTHLPQLRGRLTPAHESALRVTPDMLAVWDQRAREQGRPADWRLADAQREDTRRAVLADHGQPQDLWVFGYGSLMWDPGFHFAEVRQADLPGYQRRFSYRITGGRGTPERPALMLALERLAGCCSGLVFRIPAEAVEAESQILWRREMIRGGYCPTLLPMATRLISALALTKRKMRGLGLPGWASGVTVPTSMKPKPACNTTLGGARVSRHRLRARPPVNHCGALRGLILYKTKGYPFNVEDTSRRAHRCLA